MKIMTAVAVAAAAIVSASAGAQDLIPPSRGIPSGQAPHMQVRLIHQGGGERRFAVIFYKGDEVMSGLGDFARKYDVKDASFTAIGAASSTLASWYDLPRKAYLALPVNKQAEVVSMIGDIALVDGKPAVHAHASLVTRDGKGVGGHIWEMHVDPTLEVFVTTEDTPLAKRKDEPSGLELIDPAQ